MYMYRGKLAYVLYKHTRVHLHCKNIPKRYFFYISAQNALLKLRYVLT